MSARILIRSVVVRVQPSLPSFMLRRIRLCVTQSSPMKPAVAINKDKVEVVGRRLKSYLAFD